MNLRISPELIVDRENYINFIYYVCFALTINKFCIIRKPVSKFIASRLTIHSRGCDAARQVDFIGILAS